VARRDIMMKKKGIDDALEYLTAEEVARLLRVDLDLVYQLARDGRLPGRRLGRLWRFRRRDLDEWSGDARRSKTGV
jgi:excisionase family DNA binding protein